MQHIMRGLITAPFHCLRNSRSLLWPVKWKRLLYGIITSCPTSGTCQKLAGGGGGLETEGGSQLFETAEEGGIMKNGPLKGGGSCKCVRDHVEVHPQKKKEVLYFVKKKMGEI